MSNEYFYVAEVTYHTLQNVPATKTVSDIVKTTDAIRAFEYAKERALKGFKAFHGIEPTVLITRFVKI